MRALAALVELLPRTPNNNPALPFLGDQAILLLALRRAQGVPASAVPLVVPLLDDPGLRCDAVQLLGAMGPAAAAAAGPLAAILKSEPQWYVRSYALKALAAIGDHPGVAAALDGARRTDENVDARRAAGAALESLSGSSASPPPPR